MIREIVHIDEDKCDGCSLCVPECHEGALQIIDGKARLVSDLMCDGLGACLGHCPQDAITIEKREAAPYNETEVIALMVEKGYNTVVAHLSHLKDHNETKYLQEGVKWLLDNQQNIEFDVQKVMKEVHNGKAQAAQHVKETHNHGGGCPGSKAIDFGAIDADKSANDVQVSGKSQLQQWPVQMHLVNPNASYFQKSDVLIAADCVAFSMGNFHQDYLKGKSLAVLCPKLDSGMDSYIEKITQMVDEAQVNTITVMIMQVPCCSGLLQIVKQGVEKATRNVPIKAMVISLEGELLQEQWV